MTMKNKKAIIIGSDGQDGKIAMRLLIKNKYLVLGIDKSSFNTEGIDWKEMVDIRDKNQVFNLISSINPDEIYYLAAFNQSSEDKKISDGELFKRSYDINVFALLNFLEAIKRFSPKTKLFYASSSMIFGNTKDGLVNENTPFAPDTPYGITKLDGMMICRYFRDNYNVFASSGILFNHESEFREEKFLSRKIIQGAINIKRGLQKELILGNLGAEVDWGYAYDYVEAMRAILDLGTADDFIIASGKKHSVSEFAKEAFLCLGLHWKEYVKEDKNILTRKRNAIYGSIKKLQKATGWKPKVGFREMIMKIITKLK